MSELINMSNMSNNTLDTYLTQRGYVYRKGVGVDSGGENSISYALGYNIETEKAQKFLTKTHFVKDSLKTIAISFQTLSREEYLSIKSQILELGFEYKYSQALNSSHVLFFFKYESDKKSSSVTISASAESFEIDFLKVWKEDY